MTSEHDSNGFVVLDRRGCLERLAQHRIATLAITDGALPLVLPVMYVLHGDDILVRAARTGILGRRLPNSVISMCVHDLDDELLSGWTVTVTGLAEPFTSPAALANAASLPRWDATDASELVVRVTTDRISGREIPLREALLT
jgi:nitroimidazol reductase NimA-like FMN-containing flavoprotein (pyridoxamine 5'-phosphate oxidase superfamily)